MEGFLIRGWELILPAVALCTIPSESAISDRRVAGVSTPCGAVATRVTTVFVPRLAELYGYGTVSNTGMRTYHPRGALAHVRSPAKQRSTSGAVVFSPCGAVSTGGITVFVPRLSELY